MTPISTLNKEERPREKLLSKGACSLSDVELLAILLGTGAKGRGVLTLAQDILPLLDQKNGKLKPEDLLTVRGLGSAKACVLIAAYEFARRRIRPYGVKIKQASDILPLVSHLAGRPQEHFILVSLNGANEVIACRVLTIGLLNASQIHPREVFSEAISDRAAAVIVAHNHPSGNMVVSGEDQATTSRLKAAGELLGIPLLDHVIFSLGGYLSLKEQGLM